LLARNASQCDDDRRIPTENIEALAEAGLFRLAVPRRFGGHEVGVETSLEVAATLAEACGSTAWVMTLIGVCSWVVGLYGDRAQQEVFGVDPHARVCGVLTPTAQVQRVEGGLRVNGKWGYASGCLHAQWAVLGVPPFEADGEAVQQGLALMPMSELRIEETWFVAGMRGTGSNTLVADDVFVPDHRVMARVRTGQNCTAEPTPVSSRPTGH